MKRLICLLAFLALPVRADWILLTESEDKKEFYVEPESKKTAVNPRVWVMVNLPNPTEEGVQSVKHLYEADCKEGKIRRLYFSSYRQKMGGGSSWRSGDLTERWSFAVPDTVGEAIFDYLCVKKP